MKFLCPWKKKNHDYAIWWIKVDFTFNVLECKRKFSGRIAWEGRWSRFWSFWPCHGQNLCYARNAWESWAPAYMHQWLSLADPVLGRSCPCHSEELSGTHTGRRTMGLRLRCIHDCHALLIPLLSFIPLFAWFLWEHTAWLCNKLFAFALLAPSMSHFLHSLPFCGFMPWHVAILFHLISESYCAISMMFYCLAFVGGGPTEHLSFCNFLAMFQRHCPKYYSIFLLSC